MRQETLGTLATQYGVADTLTRGVLLVDDEPDNLAVLREFLEGDYVVYEAGSGREALALAETTGLDVVIADHRMPGMTGIELLEELRHRKPDVAGIVLTAYTDTPVLISAINRARVFRHLRKPWQPEEVLAAIAQASEQVHQGRLIAQLVDLLARRTEELGGALTDLRAAQQQMLQLERLGTMGRLTAGITHDLRNTVAGMLLLERRLSDHEIPAEVRDALEVGVASLKNLFGTLNTLNQFATGGGLHVSTARLDPSDVLRDAEAVMRMDGHFRVRRVTTSVGASLPVIRGDRQKLVQVLVNLIRNAVQATVEGQQVRIEATTAPAGGVVLAVEDEGAGVAAEVQDRLFEPFVSTRGEQGMGMGLYMARLVAESHGGGVRYVERSGGGARFEVLLPANEPGTMSTPPTG